MPITILKSVNRPIIIGDGEMKLSASLGVTHYP